MLVHSKTLLANDFLYTMTHASKSIKHSGIAIEKTVIPIFTFQNKAALGGVYIKGIPDFMEQCIQKRRGLGDFISTSPLDFNISLKHEF